MSSSTQVFLAADLGASSGRVVAGLFDGQKLTLEDVHRFENGGIVAGERMYWDILGLWSELLTGFRQAARRYGDRVVSAGVDTWGVDYGLLGPGDELLGNPRHYRDARTAGMLDEALKVVSRDEIFEETGVQFMELNTLYQLLAMKHENPKLLDSAESFLMMPDLIHWLMTGVKANEFTNATTTQFYNPRSKSWSTTLFERFGLPERILGDIVQPGTQLGPMRRSVADASGLGAIKVVLPGTHDTASAVMAVPAESAPSETPDWCYISSGTWSLMGAETPSPVINRTCSDLNFTNEGGVGDTTRLLKNIAGLWLLQESRRIWAQQGNDLDWQQIVERAASAAPLTAFINPDAADFVAPTSMPSAIQKACADSGQPVPESEGAVARCAMESLALRYRMGLESIEALTGSSIQTIHIVGGGTQNRLLCQMASDACNRRVVAGPIEATAIGNLSVQLVSSGAVSSISEAREVTRRSFEVDEYTPKNPHPWDEAYSRFTQLVDA